MGVLTWDCMHLNKNGFTFDPKGGGFTGLLDPHTFFHPIRNEEGEKETDFEKVVENVIATQYLEVRMNRQIDVYAWHLFKYVKGGEVLQQPCSTNVRVAHVVYGMIRRGRGGFTSMLFSMCCHTIPMAAPLSIFAGVFREPGEAGAEVCRVARGSTVSQHGLHRAHGDDPHAIPCMRASRQGL